MHIAFVITRGDAVGGATIHVRDMARRLRECGERVSILVGGEGEAQKQLATSGAELHILRHLRKQIHPAQDARGVAEIFGVLRRLRPNLVSTHTAKASLLGRVAARALGIPVIFTPHGWAIGDRISPWKGRVFRLAEWLGAPLVDSIVNVCEAERRLASRCGIAPLSKLEVIHNGVADVAPELRADPALAPPRLIMVARFEAPKDHALLLAALAGLASQPWTLDFVGNGPDLASAQALTAALGLTSRVRFLGGTEDVASALAKAQAFVLATRSEGFPRSILEAMRAGLPVIASDVGGVSEAVIEGETGFVVPRNDLAALREKIALLLADPAARAAMGQAGRERYEQRFTFDGTFTRTVELYGQVLERSAEADLTWEGAQQWPA